MSNIEEILRKCDNCKLNECDGCITYSDMQVIKARIKELEDKLQEINGYILTKGIDEPLKTATQIECEYQKQYIIQQEITRLKQYAKELMKEKQQLTTALLDSIPTQKVKDVLQNNRNEIFSFTYVDNEQFKPYTMQIDRINKIEKELLEEGDKDE